MNQQIYNPNNYNSFYEFEREIKKIEQDKKLLENPEIYQTVKNYVYNYIISKINQSGGYINPKINIIYFDLAYRGIVANTDIKASELLIKIPDKLYFSSDTSIANKNIYLQILNKKRDVTNFNKSFIISLELLCPSKDNEIIRLYLDSVSPRFTTIPVFYPISLCKKLRGSYILFITIKNILEYINDYDYIISEIPNFPFPLGKYIWSRIFSASRSYLNPRKNTDYLCVPISDMANHSMNINTTWYTDEKNNFCVSAIKDINKNEEIYETYGWKSNMQYLYNYGFTMNEKTKEEVHLFNSPDIETSYEEIIDIILSQEEHLELFEVINATKSILGPIISLNYKLYFTPLFDKQTQTNLEYLRNKHFDKCKSTLELEIFIFNLLINSVKNKLAIFENNINKPQKSDDFNENNVYIAYTCEYKYLKEFLEFLCFIHDYLCAFNKSASKAHKYFEKHKKNITDKYLVNYKLYYEVLPKYIKTAYKSREDINKYFGELIETKSRKRNLGELIHC